MDSVKNKASYNDDAKRVGDRMAECIQAEKKRTEVREELSYEMAEFKLTPEGDGPERVAEEEASAGEGEGSAEAGALRRGFGLGILYFTIFVTTSFNINDLFYFIVSHLFHFYLSCPLIFFNNTR